MKQYFCTKQTIINGKHGLYWHGVQSVLNNFEETDQMEDKEGAENENSM